MADKDYQSLGAVINEISPGGNTVVCQAHDRKVVCSNHAGGVIHGAEMEEK